VSKCPFCGRQQPGVVQQQVQRLCPRILIGSKSAHGFEPCEIQLTKLGTKTALPNELDSRFAARNISVCHDDVIAARSQDFRRLQAESACPTGDNGSGGRVHGSVNDRPAPSGGEHISAPEPVLQSRAEHPRLTHGARFKTQRLVDTSVISRVLLVENIRREQGQIQGQTEHV
jgi:hypothetical protein